MDYFGGQQPPTHDIWLTVRRQPDAGTADLDHIRFDHLAGLHRPVHYQALAENLAIQAFTLRNPPDLVVTH